MATTAVKKVVNLLDVPVFGASKLASKLSVWEGELTSLKVECIVNDVNEDFSKSKAITNAINKEAGCGMINDYSRLKKCPVGNAVISDGFNLPCDRVIHTATPVVKYGRMHPDSRDEELLKSCYTSTMNLCKQKKLRSVAFPCLATRAHKYNSKDAAKVEVETLVSILHESEKEFERVILCTSNAKDTEIIRSTLQDYLKTFE